MGYILKLSCCAREIDIVVVTDFDFRPNTLVQDIVASRLLSVWFARSKDSKQLISYPTEGLAMGGTKDKVCSGFASPRILAHSLHSLIQCMQSHFYWPTAASKEPLMIR